MTKSDFMNAFEVSERKMDTWLEKKWIRGAYLAEDATWFIPDSAIPPYSKRSTRCKNTIGMYASIIKACSQGKDVFPELYNMHPDRFSFFIEKLTEMGYIESRVIDGITYYMPTGKCINCNGLKDSQLKKMIKGSLDALSPAIEASSRGATSALLV